MKEEVLKEGRGSIRCRLFGHMFIDTGETFKKVDKSKYKILGFYKCKVCSRCNRIVGYEVEAPKGRV